MPVKKKPSAAQLAARAKFVKMVRAKAAVKKKAAPKKIGNTLYGKNPYTFDVKALRSNGVNVMQTRSIYADNINQAKINLKTFLVDKLGYKKIVISNGRKGHEGVKKIGGLDKITRKGKKTTVHYSRVSGVNGISLIGNVSNRKKIDILNFTKPEMVARLFLIVKDWSNLEDKIVLNKARALVWSRNTARENFIYPKIYEKKLTYNLLLYVMGNDNNLFSEAIK
jgi:hypothetical protein